MNTKPELKPEPYCVVSTIDGDHFVRLFGSYEDAVDWARSYILEEYGEDALDGMPDGERGIEEFQQTLGATEWLFVDQVTDGREEEPLST